MRSKRHDDACGKLCPPVLVEEAFVVIGASARPRRQVPRGAAWKSKSAKTQMPHELFRG
jgi:hypothetical protein